MASQNVCYAQILCEKIMNKKNKKKTMAFKTWYLVLSTEMF